MNNFKFYVQELKKIFMNNHDYMIDTLNEAKKDHEKPKYLVPEKASVVKARRDERPRVISIGRSSPAYDYFITEFRGNKLSEDGYGNVLVPGNDYYASSKTR